ncbi:adenylosuccinate lyase [Lentibacillus saliphilus]|uniref:adenylosuccinate lyase n=1 Tax=Lentibacillus saliphilus TaxID=2737028 RepID=UPI001C30813E|nr:adenylosuccinate lyase [Lentibacillus saliphilus]
MIERYTRPEMGAIWTEDNKYKAWLEVELLACEAWSELGVIPREDVKALRERASFDVERIQAIEAETRHDVVAFTRAVSETLGTERKWVHYGLTSTDVVDTALSYVLKQANAIIRKDLTELIDVLAKKAVEQKHTVMIGRTHGVHGEPTTFGMKLALWYEEMKRQLERFELAADHIEYGKLSGAVGTYANIDPFVERYVCEQLGLKPAPVSTQTLQRDRHAFYVSTLALIAGTIEKMAVEVRHLQRTEVREAEEFFAKGQKGSSAMPHKRNPIGSENMSGMARVIRGHMITAHENMALWHERDISHSSAERIILPDTTIGLNYMLSRFTRIIRDLTVYPERMLANLNVTHGLIFSQRVLLTLIDKGMARESAYDTVQPKAMEAWETGTDFKTLIEQDEAVTNVLSPEDIEACFDVTYHLKNVDALFERIGLTEK